MLVLQDRLSQNMKLEELHHHQQLQRRLVKFWGSVGQIFLKIDVILDDKVRKANNGKKTHTNYDLVQMQSLPLEVKIQMTKRRIQEWYDYWDGQVYISFSGGKDSTVLKHIVDSMYKIPSLYVDTGLEYPELKKFINDIKNGKYDCFNSDVEIVRPGKRFDEVIKEYGYPVISKEIAHKLHDQRSAHEHGRPSYVDRQFEDTYVSKNGKVNFSITKWKSLSDLSQPQRPFLVSHKCCDVMKKKPAKDYTRKTGRKPIVGTMAEESLLRKQRWIVDGCNAFKKERPSSQPLSFWTEQDVLRYIKKYNVPYASVYGDIVETDKQIGMFEKHPKLITTGCERTGCMFCMFGCHLNNDQRFVRMKKTHPKQYIYCMKPISEGGLGIKDVIDWLNENCDTKIQY